MCGASCQRRRQTASAVAPARARTVGTGENPAPSSPAVVAVVVPPVVVPAVGVGVGVVVTEVTVGIAVVEVVTVVVLATLADLRISHLDGALLLVLFGGYLVVLVTAGSPRVRGGATASATAGWVDVGRAIAGLVGIIVAAHLLVQSASTLASTAGMSDSVIGVTIVAAGTSLPEFATSIAAVRRGQTGLSAGNLVGSCIFNFLGVLGVTAILRPLSVVPTAIESTVWVLGMAAVATVLFWSNDVLSRVEGGVLTALNAANWVYDLLA